LFGVVASEAFQVDDEDGRNVVHLNLLHSLFVVDAPVAVPSVRLRQLLGPVELPEAVVNAHSFGEFLCSAHALRNAVLRILEGNKPVEARVQCPALLLVKLDQDFEFKVVRLNHLHGVVVV